MKTNLISGGTVEGFYQDTVFGVKIDKGTFV